MKYTIELTNKQKAQMDCIIDIVHRYVGFNPKLEPIKTTNVEDTYNVVYYKALEDVNHAIDVLKDMTVAECKEWFGGCIGIDDVVCAITIQDIIGRTKAYEEKKKAEDEIKVGDVIYSDLLKLNAIIAHDSGHLWRCIDTDGIGFTKLKDRLDEEWVKVGHTDELSQLFDKLKGENND